MKIINVLFWTKLCICHRRCEIPLERYEVQPAAREKTSTITLTFIILGGEVDSNVLNTCLPKILNLTNIVFLFKFPFSALFIHR